jgi:hypothetical protein
MSWKVDVSFARRPFPIRMQSRVAMPWKMRHRGLTTRQGFSRRSLLFTAAAGGAALISPAWLRASAAMLDARVAQVMAKSVGVDMPNHVYPAGAEPR